jgi:hypothetical protein
MGSRLTEIVVDCRDPAAQAAFWAAVLDYHVVRSEDGQVEIAPWEREPPDLAERVRQGPGVPTLVFVTVPEAKTVKNRLHLDAHRRIQRLRRSCLRMKRTSRRWFVGTLGRLAVVGTAGLALGVGAAPRAEAGCAVHCRVHVCDWLQGCPGAGGRPRLANVFKCTNRCDGSSFWLCRRYSFERCRSFCYSRNAC